MRKTAKKTVNKATKKVVKTQEEGRLDPGFVPVAAAFAGDGQVSLGKMFGSMGLKVNGKVFAMVVKGTLVTKLPKDRVDAIVNSNKGAYFDPGHGKLMKQWVAVSPGKAPWVELAKEAYRFVKEGAV